jgi:hypothetical protein
MNTVYSNQNFICCIFVLVIILQWQYTLYEDKIVWVSWIFLNTKALSCFFFSCFMLSNWHQYFFCLPSVSLLCAMEKHYLNKFSVFFINHIFYNIKLAMSSWKTSCREKKQGKIWSYFLCCNIFFLFIMVLFFLQESL